MAEEQSLYWEDSLKPCRDFCFHTALQGCHVWAVKSADFSEHLAAQLEDQSGGYCAQAKIILCEFG